ncbi:allophanate hydrolase [Marmoricola endophyticus]|uniref:Allophanate hydrolase n=1 Tax=Marmoricola endophyticus TaxID=2040280 RepID=A0A917BBF4_9ACTN|nr:biotin-dependent carboxyltransferase family protein [Marmoricola endophyticus]GGF32441.1 allophanate hydrolase [Marmoricola endophyticus]
MGDAASTGRPPTSLRVVSAGPQTTVQDCGRPGYAHLGVPRSGALDEPALRLANRLVGNPEDAAGLECLLGGVVLEAEASTGVAVTGAFAPVRVEGRLLPWGVAVGVPRGGRVEIGAPTQGLRVYVAVDGGIDVPPVLGSRSTDVLSGTGPAPLADGDRLPVGAGRGAPSDAEAAPVPVRRELRLRLGPRDDWFTSASLAGLEQATYTVSGDSNRVGLRLDGAGLERARDGELPSEGLVLGSVQVPPSGQLVVFLADHPTTGGYPVVGVVEPEDLAACAQLRPGDAVRLRLLR